MKKIKVLTLLLISIVLITSTKNVNAATGTGLFVNGEEFTNEKTTINCGNGTATYSDNYGIKTLILNNATITNSYTDEDNMTAGIYYDNENLLKIELKGTNTMTSNYNAAIVAGGDLLITGTGTLNISSDGNDMQIGIFANKQLDTNGSTININFTNQIDNDENFTIGIYAGSSVLIDNNTSLNIRASLGLFAMDEEEIEQDITIYNGNITISAVEAITGNLKLDDYSGKIMAGFEADGTNADVVTKNELLTLHNNYYLRYLKFGNFDTYTVNNNSTPSNLLSTPKQAFEGQKLKLIGGHDDYNNKEIYKLNQFKILNENGEDISELVNYDSATGEFIMPNYNIEIQASFTKNFKVVPKTFTAKLYGYDDVKLAWTSTKASHYQIYYKKGTATKYTSLGTTTKLTYKKPNLTPGVKYTFKIVPYSVINGKKIYSDSYKTATIYTLKRLNTPTVVKYNSSKVTVKWAKINGTTGYQIARSKYKTKNFTTIKTVGSSYSKVTVTTTRNVTYYYKVRAYKTVDGNKIYGPWSSVRTYKLR